MNNLPKTLLKAIKNTDVVCDCMVTLPVNITDEYAAFRNLQIYPITDKLIESAGRFCESYASDLLVDINSVKSAMLHDDDGIYYIGIRKSGVDHNSYVFINLKEKRFASDYYRALWAIEFHRDFEYSSNERHLKVVLKNMNYMSYDKIDDDFPIDKIDDKIAWETLTANI